MSRARIVLEMPEGVWVSEVTAEHPDATVCVLSAVPAEDSGIALITVYADDPDEIVPAIESHPGILEAELVHESTGQVTVQIETRTPMLVLSAQTSGVLIDFPVRISEGQVTLEVSGAADRLAALFEEFERAGVEYRVEYIRDDPRPEELLTETQRDLLLTAVEQGYYETPRQCSLTELAEEVGLAKSTCSETLQRAEGAVIETFVEELTGPIGLQSDVR
ncbi:Transcriptional regulator, contains HTH domain [Halalkaliarchaeum sp. AArc-CO]|uniref:helix-turn-helix domain-containing protein n=1 Tax=Halalkaliarchaeum sp. AArc-CO TaxID=2866381 RepID=UPI00217D253B|nr:helix-turn-helix domain-containing protein [Halalkaliarchaeum sp. AArc-CO]UWG49510.1 Transcriptional regulator, contains HTH domain [Halalkaliarchaeum sp. AArc-CO]